MKKWIAAMLTLIMLVGMLPVNALAVIVSGKILTEDELATYMVLAGLNDGAFADVGSRQNDHVRGDPCAIVDPNRL